MSGDWTEDVINQIVIPTGATSGQRVVIGQVIPAELTAKYGAGNVIGCLLFYGTTAGEYSYQALLKNTVQLKTQVVYGVVRAGTVMETYRTLLDTLVPPGVPNFRVADDPTVPSNQVDFGDPATQCFGQVNVYLSNGLQIFPIDPTLIAPFRINNIDQGQGVLQKKYMTGGVLVTSTAGAVGTWAGPWTDGVTPFRYRSGRVYELRTRFCTLHNGAAASDGETEVRLLKEINTLAANTQILRTWRVDTPASFPETYEFTVTVKNETVGDLSYVPGFDVKGIWGGGAPTIHTLYGDGTYLCDIQLKDVGAITDPVAFGPDVVSLT